MFVGVKIDVARRVKYEAQFAAIRRPGEELLGLARLHLTRAPAREVAISTMRIVGLTDRPLPAPTDQIFQVDVSGITTVSGLPGKPLRGPKVVVTTTRGEVAFDLNDNADVVPFTECVRDALHRSVRAASTQEEPIAGESDVARLSGVKGTAMTTTPVDERTLALSALTDASPPIEAPASVDPFVSPSLKEKRRVAALQQIADGLRDPELLGGLYRCTQMNGADVLVVTTQRAFPLAPNQPITTMMNGQVWHAQAKSVEVSAGIAGTRLLFHTLPGTSVRTGTFSVPEEAPQAAAIITLLAERNSMSESADIQKHSSDIAAADEAFASRVHGSPTRKSLEEVRRHLRPGEVPEFIIGVGMAGTLAAFEDRCLIIKKGGGAGMLAGSIGGGRVTTFMYGQVTGVEYNSGLFNGVLEILTPSYQGSANKDFWRGTNQSRNANANDPFTLSNTLPMDRTTFERHRGHIDRMRHLIVAASRPVVHVHTAEAAPPEPRSGSSLAEEIGKLGELHRTGVLDEEEFRQAKQAAIAKHTSS